MTRGSPGGLQTVSYVCDLVEEIQHWGILTVFHTIPESEATTFLSGDLFMHLLQSEVMSNIIN